MTPELIKLLRELLAKATRLPWRAACDSDGSFDIWALEQFQACTCVAQRGPWRAHAEESRANAELIVTLVNALPDLLAALEAQPEAAPVVGPQEQK